MTRKQALSWWKPQGRWRKIYKGKQWHSKVCAKSDIEAYRLAVEQCEEWKAKIDADLQAKKEKAQAEQLASNIQGRIAKQVSTLRSIAAIFAKRLPDRAEAIERNIVQLQARPDLLPLYEEKPVLAIEPFAVEIVRSRLNGRTIEASKQLSECLKVWIDDKAAAAQAGEIAGGTVDNLDRQAKLFIEWFGKPSTEDIDANTIPDFRKHLLKAFPNSRNTAKDYLQGVKQFLRWCNDRDRLKALPKNFDRKITGQVRVVVVWSLEQVKQAVKEVPEQLKLYLLLMLNCGFYQSDLSGLLDEKVDWKEGRITHKREKTKKYENVPTINYKLWPETFRLLKKHRSGEEFVLLSSTGKQLITKVRDENGKTQKNDHVHQIWKRWCDAKGLKFPPLKCLRKTGGNALKNKFGYGVGEHYLGHAPRTIGDKSYFQPPTQLEFDAAVAWLAAMA